MSTLWFLIGAILIGAVTYIGLRGARLRFAAEQSADAIFRQRRAELERDLADGTLEASARQTLEEELARIAVREVRTSSAGDTPRGNRLAALLVLIVLLGAVAIPVYLQLGMPQMANGEEAAAAGGGRGNHPSPEQMVAELEKRIAATPDDPEPRMWLARVYVSKQKYGQAVDEFEAVLKLAGDIPAVLVQYADALAMLNGGRLSGRPAELVQRALAVEPANPTALWLAGLAAEEAGKKDEALSYLTRARQAAIAAEQPVEELDTQIVALGGSVDAAPGAPATPPMSAAPAPIQTAGGEQGPRIEVKVSLDPALAAKVGPNAMLFILAKRPAGMPMPLAVKRLPASALPVTVVLDDSLAMSPAARLSSADSVDVIARISQTGQAIAASGDLEGKQAGVAVTADGHVAIAIDRLLP